VRQLMKLHFDFHAFVDSLDHAPKPTLAPGLGSRHLAAALPTRGFRLLPGRAKLTPTGGIYE
jgi:hypothetical protein